MPEDVHFVLNGCAALAPKGASVAVAVLMNGVTQFRNSVSGEARAPLCGMGICYECRLTIDGKPHMRSCMIAVGPGMVVDSGT